MYCKTCLSRCRSGKNQGIGGAFGAWFCWIPTKGGPPTIVIVIGVRWGPENKQGEIFTPVKPMEFSATDKGVSYFTPFLLRSARIRPPCGILFMKGIVLKGVARFESPNKLPKLFPRHPKSSKYLLTMCFRWVQTSSKEVFGCLGIIQLIEGFRWQIQMRRKVA